MNSWFKRVFTSYLSTGTSDKYDHDTNNIFFVSNLFSFIGYSITFVLSISAFIRADVPLATSLFCACLLFFFCHQVHRFHAIANTIRISTSLLLFSLIVLVIYLVYSGGNNNTGPLWIYLVPPVAFFFKGLYKGALYLSCFIGVVALMLFFPSDALLDASYITAFKLRLIYSFITVSLLFGFYEYSRNKSYLAVQSLSQEFEKKAMQDPLTKLPNRRGIREKLNYEAKRAEWSNLPLTILVCDIDNFKSINDVYMHEGGDFILEQLSVLFIQSIREQDYASRWGGEEFLFMLPDTPVKDGFILAEKLRCIIEASVFHYKGADIKITLSIGLSEVNHGISIDQAINSADRHLYDAKQSGRNKVCPAHVVV